MKFIHLTDTHIIGGNRLLYGANPAQRLKLAVDSINAEHGDAEFVMVTGDMTHWGDADAYAAFQKQISRLEMPVHLLVGNHDDTAAFATHFPDAPRDENGFVQFTFDMRHGRAICLDTKSQGSHAGGYCQARLEWLHNQLQGSDDPVLLFMHHPPFKVGITAMDEIMMLDADALYDVIRPHKPRIRHLFFGHIHRAIFGNWRGISFSCMRGLNHQVSLNLTAGQTEIPGNFEAPAYGVVLVDDQSVTVHMHDFTNNSPAFFLNAPPGMDPLRYQLDMVHEGHDDP
ncbi:diethylphosphate phosphodiesterase [Aliiroseovarius halocynthiae]|uniref:Phosphodiesterase n=1 Tax=Aliiroseovarius halocynthiae TaxID=985055 RepID=A0A545SVR5_9RHOB|nr:phosphodiesterase [Aliiroseovarius halocynthiae]TQV69055.1 phosphodiesterase [Aliiroseovarius halocynthiae]SMR71807.1 diethylphosphate phosphodiesterase [Aliiroseovarius halocynthiae]